MPDSVSRMGGTRRLAAIQTKYKGHLFRSRLEARWAVFFDALGIAWEYEPEGYLLSDGSRYLPDFLLPGFHLTGGVFVEVKPQGGDTSKARQFAIDSDGAVLIAVGTPSAQAPMRCLFTDVNHGARKVLMDYPVWFGESDGFQVGEYPGNGHDRLVHAAAAARQARFEHGQVGAPSEWRR